MSESPAIGEATPELELCTEHFSPRRDNENPPICKKAFAKGLYPCEFPASASPVDGATPYPTEGLEAEPGFDLSNDWVGVLGRALQGRGSASPVDGATRPTSTELQRAIERVAQCRRLNTYMGGVVRPEEQCSGVPTRELDVVLAAASPVETEATPPQERESVGTMHDRAMAHADGGELLQAFHWEAMAAVRAGDLGVSDATQVILLRSAANLARTIVDDLLKHAHAARLTPTLFTREEILSLTTDRFGAVEKRAILEYGDARYTEALLELAEADSQVRSLREELEAIQDQLDVSRVACGVVSEANERLRADLAASESEVRSLREALAAAQTARDIASKDYKADVNRWCNDEQGAMVCSQLHYDELCAKLAASESSARSLVLAAKRESRAIERCMWEHGNQDQTACERCVRDMEFVYPR